MSKVFTVVSGKGGVGKSTFCANVAISLAGQNKKVLLIDGDAGLRSLDLLLSVDSMVVYDWLDIIENRCDHNKARLFFNDNLIVYKGGHAYDKGYNNNEYWFKVIDGVLYKIRYYYNGVGNAAHFTLEITKYDPENHVLGYSENGDIIVSEKDYNNLIKTPYTTAGNPYPFIPTQCFYISNDATEDDITVLKNAYENPNVIKEYKNFSK